MKATHFEVGNFTDIGLNPTRDKNEDYYGRFDGDFGTLLIVCDGIGGNAGGEIASRLAVDAIHSYIAKHHIPTEETMIIRQSVEHAQQKIMEAVNENPTLAGMGSTLVLLLIREHQFWYAHLGDSRLYLRRDDAITRLTRDHTEVQNLVDLGVIKEEDAASHPRRNVLSKALGHDMGEPEISGPHTLYPDDVFLLCTDGLTEYLQDAEILDYLTESPQVAAHNLVDEAKRRGGLDNITVQIVQIVHTPGSPAKQKRLEEEHDISNRPPIDFKKYLVYLLILIVSVIIIIQIPPACRKLFTKKPMTHEDSLRVAAKEAEKAAKKAEKEKKGKGKDTKQEAETRQDPALDSALAERLNAKDATKPYQEHLDKLRAANLSAKMPTKIRFTELYPDGRSLFVSPGQTIYVSYNHLANDLKVQAEQIQFLITIAAAMEDSPASENELFSGAARAVDQALLDRARSLYLNMNPNGSNDFRRINDKIGSHIKQAKSCLIYQ